MKAAVVKRPNETPVCADFAEPDVTDRKAVVELVAAGIHGVVRSRVAGRHYSVAGQWPAVAGVDAVARTPDGRLVYTGFVDPPWGTMAERMAVPAQFGIELPVGTDPLAVAAGMNPGSASWLPLAAHADKRGGSGLGTVLVLGATGMAGGLAVQNSYVLGASRVVAVGRNVDRLAQLSAPTPQTSLATVALTGERDANSAAMASALGGTPPSIVLDFCWGPVAQAAFYALGDPSLDVDDYDVSYVQIGTTAGPDAPVPGALLRSRNLTLSGSGLGGTPLPEIMRRVPEFIEQIATGRVHVRYTPYPLSRISEAWLAADGTRAVVVPDGASG